MLRNPSAQRPSHHHRRPAFSLVELLVVVAAVGLLVTLIVSVSGQAVYAQRVRNTEAVMQNVQLAIDQFREINPLRRTYDGRYDKRFGDLPPFQLHYNGPWNQPGPAATLQQVGYLIDPTPPQFQGSGTRDLTDRIARDLGTGGALGLPVQISRNDPWNNDIRALYTYLRVFVPDAVELVPQQYRKPLTGTAEYLVTGQNQNRDRIEIHGFFDAWGVPLDYGMYARVKVVPDFVNQRNANTNVGRWDVVERLPLLRSNGIDQEKYDAIKRLDGAARDRVVNPGDSILNLPAPAPLADVNDETGVLPLPDVGAIRRQAGGWLRVPAGWENGAERDWFGYRVDTP